MHHASRLHKELAAPSSRLTYAAHMQNVTLPGRILTLTFSCLTNCCQTVHSCHKHPLVLRAFYAYRPDHQLSRTSQSLMHFTATTLAISCFTATILAIILSTVKFLARQGLALRGHQVDKQNFQQLQQMKAEDCPEIKTWLKRKHDWCSPEIQNEMLQLLANELMRR
ncbi:hypothetical protein PR048_004492 [Dryococelus australis]|uniref:Uncharacterized protein n=1 Tax=Dryococelus australis TaxID=614101 RepID=A0ABQ9I5K6_9NEOP|nr:hypothetical protein PR048_004492 [Dryococelus australis]